MDFEKSRKISKDFDFFTIDLEKFTIVFENFAKSRGQFNETRKKKLARFVRSSHRGYRKYILSHPDGIVAHPMG